MKHKKLTPLEILLKQKADLQAKSDILSGSIENHVKYLHNNSASLLSDTLIDSAVSKLPPQLQSLVGSFLQKKRETDAQETNDSNFGKFIIGAAIGITEIAPFFIRGKKGMFISLLMKQIMKFATKVKD